MDHLRTASLPPIEDRLSIILSRLESIETSLRHLQDIKKVLREIEDNTHPDGDSKSVDREDMTEKVRDRYIVVGFYFCHIPAPSLDKPDTLGGSRAPSCLSSADKLDNFWRSTLREGAHSCYFSYLIMINN